MSKLLFFDVDGTLTNNKSSVSDVVREAIKKARDHGHYAFICTGRNKAGIRELKDIEFDGYVCSAGGYIEVDHKVIHTSYLSDEDVVEARTLLEELGVVYNLEATDITFSDANLDELFAKSLLGDSVLNSELQRIVSANKKAYNIHELYEYDLNPVPVHKICFVATNKEAVEVIKEKLSYKYKIIIHASNSSDLINGEFIIKGTNKGLAVEKVAEYLNLSIEDTIGFGDSMNDYEMIKTCQVGVVMENGSDELKKYATVICESVDNDGVYHEMKRLNII